MTIRPDLQKEHYRLKAVRIEILNEERVVVSDPDPVHVHVGLTFNDLKLYVVNFWMKLSTPFTLAILSTIVKNFRAVESDQPMQVQAVVVVDQAGSPERALQINLQLYIVNFWMKLPQVPTPFTLASLSTI